MDYNSLTLREICDEAEVIARDAETSFGHLSSQQLNWKPNADSWSVAQCLDHLITINRAYYPIFERVLKGEYRRSPMHRLPGVPAMFGRMMIRALSPNSRRRFKAPRTAQPSSSAVDPDIVKRFVTHQREVLARIGSLEARDPAHTIITSPFAPVVVYSLLDAFRLIVAHERRHFVQAQRVMAAAGFPER